MHSLSHPYIFSFKKSFYGDFCDISKLLMILQLNIQFIYTGLLESVSNLTVTPFNSSSTVLISWSPPFTLEGVSILGYNVTIAKMISGENETMLAQNTTLLYSIDHPDPGNNFTVTVVPINEVGAGQPVTLVFSLCKCKLLQLLV